MVLASHHGSWLPARSRGSMGLGARRQGLAALCGLEGLGLGLRV